MGKIATEQEAYSIGKKGTPAGNKLCTKSRVSVLGCKVKGSYQDNQCVQLSDLETATTYNYYLSFSYNGASYLNVSEQENRYTVTVKSYKKEVINGVEQSVEIQVPFTASLPSGVTWTYFNFTSPNSYVHVTANYDYPVKEKQTTMTITQNEGTKSILVPIVQKPAVVEYSKVVFDVSYGSSSFPIAGGTFNYVVTSKVNVYINTIPSAVATNVDQTFTVSGDSEGLVKSGLSSYLVEKNNSEKRSWILIFTQDGTKASQSVEITQAGSTVTTNYTLQLRTDITNPNSPWYGKLSGLVSNKAYVLLCEKMNKAGESYEVPMSGAYDLSSMYWYNLQRSTSSGYLTSGTNTFTKNGLDVRQLQKDDIALVKQWGKVHCYAYINNGTSAPVNQQNLTYLKYLGYFELLMEDRVVFVDSLMKDE